MSKDNKKTRHRSPQPSVSKNIEWSLLCRFAIVNGIAQNVKDDQLAWIPDSVQKYGAEYARFQERSAVVEVYQSGFLTTPPLAPELLPMLSRAVKALSEGKAFDSINTTDAIVIDSPKLLRVVIIYFGNNDHLFHVGYSITNVGYDTWQRQLFLGNGENDIVDLQRHQVASIARLYSEEGVPENQIGVILHHQPDEEVPGTTTKVKGQVLAVCESSVSQDELRRTIEGTIASSIRKPYPSWSLTDQDISSVVTTTSRMLEAVKHAGQGALLLWASPGIIPPESRVAAVGAEEARTEHEPTRWRIALSERIELPVPIEPFVTFSPDFAQFRWMNPDGSSSPAYLALRARVYKGGTQAVQFTFGSANESDEHRHWIEKKQWFPANQSGIVPDDRDAGKVAYCDNPFIAAGRLLLNRGQWYLSYLIFIFDHQGRGVTSFSWRGMLWEDWVKIRSFHRKPVENFLRLTRDLASERTAPYTPELLSDRVTLHTPPMGGEILTHKSKVVDKDSTTVVEELLHPKPRQQEIGDQETLSMPQLMNAVSERLTKDLSDYSRLDRAPATNMPAQLDVLRNTVKSLLEPVRGEVKAFIEAINALPPEERTMGSLEGNKKFASEFQAMLSLVDLRLCCPNCGKAGTLRCIAGTSPKGAFQFTHTVGSARQSHGGWASLPELKLR